MNISKPFVVIVEGALILNLVIDVNGIAHTIHEAYPSQNITRIFVAGTTASSGGTIFISGDTN